MLPKIHKASRYVSGLVSVGGSKYGSVYSNFPEVKKLKRDFDSLNMSEHDVGHMYKLFRGCDSIKNDCVKIPKLLAYLKIGKSKFAEKLFSSFDIQKSEHFVFDLYDKFREGELEGGEVRSIIRDLYGEQYVKNQAARKAYFSLEEIEGLVITAANFSLLCSIHETLLMPATILQSKLRDDFLSIDFWYESYELRAEVSRGKFLSLEAALRRLQRRLRDTGIDANKWNGQHAQPLESQGDALMQLDGEESVATETTTKSKLSPRSRAKKNKRVAREGVTNNPHIYMNKMGRAAAYRSPYAMPSSVHLLPSIGKQKKAQDSVLADSTLKVSAPTQRMRKRRRQKDVRKIASSLMDRRNIGGGICC